VQRYDFPLVDWGNKVQETGGLGSGNTGEKNMTTGTTVAYIVDHAYP
jgi:hypothetical protein